MKQPDYAKFKAALTELADAYRESLTPGQITAYWKQLAEYDLASVLSAFIRAPKSHPTFFPKSGELVLLISGHADDNSSIAWHTFRSASENGEMMSVYVYDKGMAYAIEAMGGWVCAVMELRECSPEMIASHEKRFKASYRIAADTPSLCKTQYFAGQGEIANRENAEGLTCWAERTKAASITLKVVVISTDKHAVLEMPFEPRSMAMLPEAKERLLAGDKGLQAYLPQPYEHPQKALPESTGSISLEEQQKVIDTIRQLTSGSSRSDGSFVAALTTGLEEQ